VSDFFDELAEQVGMTREEAVLAIYVASKDAKPELMLSLVPRGRPHKALGLPRRCVRLTANGWPVEFLARAA
jgi:hypothetical protein